MNKKLTDDLRSEAPHSSYRIEEEEEEEASDDWKYYSSYQIANEIGRNVVYYLRDNIKSKYEGMESKKNVFLKDIEDLVKVLIQSDDYSNDEIKELFYALKDYEPDTYKNLLEIVENRHEKC